MGTEQPEGAAAAGVSPQARPRLPTIADRDVGRSNNFNLLRMAAATAVLISHAWPIALGMGTTEPLQAVTGYKLGTTAVTLFFAVSGFFIVKSFDRRQSLADFTLARVFRIYPALIVVLLMTVLLLGPLVSDLTAAAYAADRQSWTYVPRNLMLWRPQWALPGVFVDNPGGTAINGSLWTLWFEVLCYAAVVALGFLRLLRPIFYPVILIAASVPALLVAQGEHSGFLGLTSILFLPFALGGAAYVYRAHIPLSGWIAGGLVVAAALAMGTAVYPVLHALALSYGAIWFGFSVPSLRGYNRFGDYSYGMYIYAFPIEQLVAWLVPGAGPWTVIGWSLPVTLVLAILSWTLVEKPALARRHILRRWRGQGAPAAAP